MKGIEVVSMIKINGSWVNQEDLSKEEFSQIRRDNEKYRIRKKKNRLGGRKGGQAWKLKEPTTARLPTTPTH